MIEIYEGRLGGGKSYSATVRMVDHFRRGGLVCTNVEIVWEEVKKYCAKKFGVEVEEDQFIKLENEHVPLFHRHTPSGTKELPVLVVLDEAHLHFNARDWAKASAELLAFLTQSRKVATDIIFISQSALNIDKQFMRLVQYIWRFRDLTKWRIAGIGIAWPLNQILMCQYDYDGISLLSRQFIFKDKDIFKLYNTNSLLREFPRLEGVKTKRELKKVKPNHMFKIVFILIIIAGVIAFFSLKKSFVKAPPPTPQQSAGFTSKQPESDDKRAKLKYDIYDEHFRGFMQNPPTVITDGGWYEAGEMSNKGYVLAVSHDRVKVAEPDGRTGWVMATAYEPTSIQPGVSPSPSPTPPIVTPNPVRPSGPDPSGANRSPFMKETDSEFQQQLNTRYVGGRAVGGGE